jgi:glycine/D-amino acid oxidase-like deaminating enzyme
VATAPWPDTPPSPAHRAAYAGAEPRPYWLAALGERPAAPALRGLADADLCIVGGGFTGLWAALHAKAGDPGRDVVVLEAEVAGFGASGRNGGFAAASLTHGLANGLARFADELPVLERLGMENFAGLKADLHRHGIDCAFEETGTLTVALTPNGEREIVEEAALLRRFGHEAELLDGPAMRAEVASPTYRGGVWDRTGAALLDPGRLAAGLRETAVRLGVRLHEHSPAAALEAAPGAVAVLTPQGRVRARRVLLATSAFPPLLRAIRRYVLPVYDYVLVTEPLTAAQRAAIGWRRRQGLADAANQFHYYRLTADDRILWGGYDAVYRYGGPVGPALDEHERTFARLSQHFAATFPQLEASASPIAGAARSTPRAASPSSSAPRTAAG